jgi:hypothetical protein
MLDSDLEVGFVNRIKHFREVCAALDLIQSLLSER